MGNTLDDLTLDLARDLQTEKLRKYLPPKLAYRFREWLRRFGGKASGKSKPTQQQVSGILAQKVEEMVALSELKKNETMASFYDNGIVKMDFGSEVSDKTKKAALAWAKRKGLKAIEATLNKSTTMSESTLFTQDKINVAECGPCLQRVKFS
jgi:hypothetical protein